LWAEDVGAGLSRPDFEVAIRIELIGLLLSTMLALLRRKERTRAGAWKNVDMSVSVSGKGNNAHAFGGDLRKELGINLPRIQSLVAAMRLTPGRLASAYAKSPW
jgi:hypothetical protein